MAFIKTIYPGKVKGTGYGEFLFLTDVTVPMSLRINADESDT